MIIMLVGFVVISQILKMHNLGDIRWLQAGGVVLIMVVVDALTVQLVKMSSLTWTK